MVERAAAQYAPKAAGKGITLTTRQVEGSAVFDPKWTEEAVCNLLDNAVKYTPSGGTVAVEVKNYELFSAIRVSDTGPGIPEGEQAKIFGRFYRASGAYQTEGRGHWSLPYPPDCGETGRLCEGREHSWERKHIFSVSSAALRNFFQNCHIFESTRTDFHG